MSRQFFAEPLWWVTTNGTAVANSTTETIIFPNVTIPGNYMQDGRLLEIIAWGEYSTTTGPPTGRFRLRWGGVSGTVLADSGTVTTIASTTNAIWRAEIEVQTRSNGSAGTLMPYLKLDFGNGSAATIGSATGAPAITLASSAGITAPAAVTVDLTADTPLALTFQWSAASASNTLTGQNYRGLALN